MIVFSVVLLVLALALLVVGFLTKKAVPAKKPAPVSSSATSPTPAPPPTPSTSFSWAWIGWFLGGVAVAGLVSFFLFSSSSNKNAPSPKRLKVGDVYASHQFTGGNETWELEVIPGKYRVRYEVEKSPGKEIGISVKNYAGKYSSFVALKGFSQGQQEIIRIRSDVKQKIIFFWNGSR